MPFPAVDLFPSDTLFPGDPIPVDVGGYSQPIECAANGLVLTATDDQGVDWVQDTLDGWYGGAASSMQTTQKIAAPGAWPGPRQSTARPLTIAGYGEAPDAAAALDAMDRFNAAISLDAFVFTVSEPGGVRSVIAYRDADSIDTTRTGDTTFEWSAQLICPDPRKFGAAVSDITGLPASTGGLVIPLVVPAVIAEMSIAGAVSLNNPGNQTGPVVVRIDGPITGPVITHVGSGLQVVFASSLSLGAGEFLIVDMEARTALAQGQASRNGSITERGWSGFDPGDNTWRVDSAAYNPAARFTVTATPAWQ